jgi:hypothetical protein
MLSSPTTSTQCAIAPSRGIIQIISLPMLFSHRWQKSDAPKVLSLSSGLAASAGPRRGRRLLMMINSGQSSAPFPQGRSSSI